MFDHWFTIVRQVITFGLGVWVVAYAVTSPGTDIGFIFAGFALIGLIPVEEFFRGMTMVRRRPNGNGGNGNGRHTDG